MVYKLEQGRPVRPGETGILSDGRGVAWSYLIGQEEFCKKNM